MSEARTILHIDMDAFYASVEQLDNPQLKGKPVIVGGSARQRGVVAAASYEVRKYGVYSAMPIAQAMRLCPHAILLPVRMSRYAQISKQFHKIFYDYTPQIEPLSLDEAFLDVTGSIQLFGSAQRIGREIKERIMRELALTASVGVAPNKFLAKLASDMQKPDGFVVIKEENKQQILDPLPVSRIWGIGKVTAGLLNAKGIHIIEQIRNTPLPILQTLLGNQAQEILNLAQGIDERPVESSREAKSISAEETFAEDIIDKDTLLKVLSHQVEQVAYRLRADSVEGKTITLKLRYGDFTTITRSRTMTEFTNITKLLYKTAAAIFEQWHKRSAAKIRLLGFGVSNLRAEGSGQRLLFSEPSDKKQKSIDAIFDKIRNKYGDDALTRGQ
jgi:DNA polymerase IV